MIFKYFIISYMVCQATQGTLEILIQDMPIRLKIIALRD